jgi:hypothetical protein
VRLTETETGASPPTTPGTPITSPAVDWFQALPSPTVGGLHQSRGRNTIHTSRLSSKGAARLDSEQGHPDSGRSYSGLRQRLRGRSLKGRCLSDGMDSGPSSLPPDQLPVALSHGDINNALEDLHHVHIYFHHVLCDIYHVLRDLYHVQIDFNIT